MYWLAALAVNHLHKSGRHWLMGHLIFECCLSKIWVLLINCFSVSRDFCRWFLTGADMSCIRCDSLKYVWFENQIGQDLFIGMVLIKKFRQINFMPYNLHLNVFAFIMSRAMLQNVLYNIFSVKLLFYVISNFKLWCSWWSSSHMYASLLNRR